VSFNINSLECTLLWFVQTIVSTTFLVTNYPSPLWKVFGMDRVASFSVL